MQRYIRWSVVCSSVPQGHVALSSSLNRCRLDLILPCPVTMAVKLGATFILALILSEMLGKNCLVSAAFGLSSHAFCHFIIVSSSNSLYIVLFGILLYVIVLYIYTRTYIYKQYTTDN